jgi:hypothetical protein
MLYVIKGRHFLIARKKALLQAGQGVSINLKAGK